ncbi:endonuclease NucS [Thermococcus pacificus]|nr:endonuclease NucS [Thermococcus pacificus]
MPKVEFKANPSPEEIKLLVDSAISSEGMLTIFARCKVHYDGRAKSELGSGDRVIIVKPDGSFLIHQNRKREPVNWQPPGSFVTLEERDGTLVLRSVRRKPKEILEVELDEVYLVSVFRAEDYEELALTGSEAEMAEMIFENPELIEPGFKPLFREKDIGHGIVDILGRDESGNLVVLELKRRKADLHAVSQLKRYVEALKKEHPDVRGILVAPSLTSGAKKLLQKEGLEFKKVEPPKRDRSGRGRQTTLL